MDATATIGQQVLYIGSKTELYGVYTLAPCTNCRRCDVMAAENRLAAAIGYEVTELEPRYALIDETGEEIVYHVRRQSVIPV